MLRGAVLTPIPHTKYMPTSNKKIRKCNVCKVVLTSSNSGYPATSNLFCRKHYYGAKKACLKKYHSSPKGKKAVTEAAKRAYLNHKEKWLARAKARYAVKIGTLIKPNKCEVCNEVKLLQGHHEDYSKPLEVIWLCWACHADADREMEKRNK